MRLVALAASVFVIAAGCSPTPSRPSRLPLHSKPPIRIQNRRTEAHENAPKRESIGVTIGVKLSGIGAWTGLSHRNHDRRWTVMVATSEVEWLRVSYKPTIRLG